MQAKTCCLGVVYTKNSEWVLRSYERDKVLSSPPWCLVTYNFKSSMIESFHSPKPAVQSLQIEEVPTSHIPICLHFICLEV